MPIEPKLSPPEIFSIVSSLSVLAIRKASLTAAITKSESISTSSGSTASGESLMSVSWRLPLTVTLTVSVYDFHTLEEGAEAAPAEQKGESK